MIARRHLLLLIAAAPFGTASAQASVPQAPIAALNDGLLQVMRAGKATPFASRMGLLTPIVQASFDLLQILQNSVGPARWPSIAAPQRAELVDVFTQFTVASYVANFDSFSGEKFVIAADLRPAGAEQVVQTRIVGTAGETTRLDYVMRQGPAGWQVVDVLLDGTISRVAVTRSDFRALLGQGDAARLIDSLRGKVAGLAAGAAPQ